MGLYIVLMNEETGALEGHTDYKFPLLTHYI